MDPVLIYSRPWYGCCCGCSGESIAGCCGGVYNTNTTGMTSILGFVPYIHDGTTVVSRWLLWFRFRLRMRMHGSGTVPPRQAAQGCCGCDGEFAGTGRTDTSSTRIITSVPHDCLATRTQTGKIRTHTQSYCSRVIIIIIIIITLHHTEARASSYRDDDAAPHHMNHYYASPK